MSVAPSVFAFAARHDCAAEMEVLLRLAAGDEDRDDVSAALARANPAVLLDVARLNKVLHLLWGARPTLERVAPAMLRPLDRFRLRTIAANQRCLSETAEIARLLRAARISHVHFKGPLQQSALHGNAFLKPTADIDILVRPGDRLRAGRQLEAKGWRPQGAEMASWWTRHLGEEHYARGEDEPAVDLHHRLQQPGSPGLRDEARFIDDAVDVVHGQQAIAVPSPPHVCLVIAANLGKAVIAREPCLSHAFDMRAALRRLSRDEAARLPGLARAHGMTETLVFATHAADILLAGAKGPRHAIGTNPLADVPDPTLVAMIACPWDARIEWPRRRRILWALCGRAPLRFLSEARRSAMSEFHRRALEARVGSASPDR